MHDASMTTSPPHVQVLIHDAQSGERVLRMSGPIKAVSYLQAPLPASGGSSSSSTSPYLLAGGTDRAVRVWDSLTGGAGESVVRPNAHDACFLATTWCSLL